MPQVKVELAEGKTLKELQDLQKTILDAVVDALKLPKDDRNIRVIEYKKELFQMKDPYEILIEITLFSGRTKETKKLLYQSIVNNIQKSLGIVREKVFIILNEQQQENWGVRGGIPANEIKLNFKVDI